ncbi:MAG: NfeD family protein [Phycisphaerae bacterium]
MIGILGVYAELKTPGLGLPGLLAVVCFAILFGSRYLVGMATWWEAAIFAVGIALLFLEVFVIPGFGIAGVCGIICILIGLFGILVPNRPDELPWPKYDFGDLQWKLLTDSGLAMGIGFIGFMIAAYFLAKFLPKTSAFAGLVLSPAMAGEKLQINATAPPEVSEKIQIGDSGIAITKLRPAGRAKFQNTVVDVITEGDLIDKDCRVSIMRIEGNKVVVKQS